MLTFSLSLRHWRLCKPFASQIHKESTCRWMDWTLNANVTVHEVISLQRFILLRLRIFRSLSISQFEHKIVQSVTQNVQNPGIEPDRRITQFFKALSFLIRYRRRTTDIHWDKTNVNTVMKINSKNLLQRKRAMQEAAQLMHKLLHCFVGVTRNLKKEWSLTGQTKLLSVVNIMTPRIPSVKLKYHSSTAQC